MANIDINKKSNELKDIVSKYNKESFIGFFSYHIRQRPPHESGNAFDLFKSKLQDFLYLIGLSAFSNNPENEDFVAKGDTLSELANRINEIKSAYTLNDFSFTKARNDLSYQQKGIIHEFTFNNYFHNGDLTFMEQDIDSFQRTFESLEDLIIEDFGFDIKFLIDVFIFLERFVKDKFRKNMEFTWSEEFNKFHEASLSKEFSLKNSFESLSPTVRKSFEKFLNCSHDFLKVNLSDLYKVFPKKSIDNFLKIFSCDGSEKLDYLYYTDINPFETKPIFKINNEEYLSIFQKQLPIAYYKFFYNYFKSRLENTERLQKIRGKVLERKCFEIFQDFLLNEKRTYFYRNYFIDKQYEQDLLVISKGTAFIIETKASRFREPLRNMDKAFNKINSDFKDNIQNGFNQCLRVKRKFDSSKIFPIYNNKGEVLFEINPKKINNVYSIVVTIERFGPIQQDLSYLLSIDDTEDYPWSVYINDLETFLRALKIKTNNQRNELVTYIKNRELLHGRLFCFDELDICAFYMSNKEQFIKLANQTNSTFSMMSDNQNYFDDMYFQGIGLLKNELFLDEKKATGYKPDERKIRAFALDNY